MQMIKGPKYITGEHIPWPLAFKEHPQFCITSIDELNDELILHYQNKGRGFSIYSTDKHEFDQMPKRYEMISGGWYWDKGRWSPVERYTGSLLCKNVTQFKQVDHDGKDYSFSVKKSWFSAAKKIRVESESVGVVEIECESINTQEHTVEIFSLEENKWVLRSSIENKK